MERGDVWVSPPLPQPKPTHPNTMTSSVSAVYQARIKDLHARGWDEASNTYTPWGDLVVGYFNSSREIRQEYLRFLIGISAEDPSDVCAREHISAILRATDMATNEKEYGGYGAIFLGKIRVCEAGEENLIGDISVSI